MKRFLRFLTIAIVIAALVAVLCVFFFGVRLLPGGVVFSLARALGREARLDNDMALALALAVATVGGLFLSRGFSWRKLAMVTVATPLMFAAFFAARSILHNRPTDVSDPDSVRWFDQYGKPRLYFARRSDGSLEFFNGPGCHPRTGERLEAVTKNISMEWFEAQKKQVSQNEENTALKDQLVRQLAAKEKMERDLTMDFTTKLKQEKEDRQKTEDELKKHLKQARDLAVQVQQQLQELSRTALEDKQAAEAERARLDREKSTRAEAAPISPALSDAGPKSATVTMRFRNATSFRIFASFSSPEYHHAWPSPGNAYVIEVGQTGTITLCGVGGEQIFFRGWCPENPSLHWDGCDCDEFGQAKPIATIGQGNPPPRTLTQRL